MPGSGPTPCSGRPQTQREEGQCLVTYPVLSKSQHQAPLPGPGPTSCPNLPPHLACSTTSKGHQMEECPGAAGTESHRPGASNNRNLLSPGCGRQRSKTQVSAGLVPWEAVREGLSQASLSSLCPNLLSVWVISSSERTPVVGLRATLLQDDLTLRSLTNHICKDLISI